MYLPDFSETRFNEIESEYRKFLVDLALEASAFVPASARSGENVAQPSTKMKWYRGPSVLEALDLLRPAKSDVDLPLRFCVEDVYRFDDRRIVAGRIETGTLRVGDELIFSPANKSSKVQTIEGPHPTLSLRERRTANPPGEGDNGGSVEIAIAGDSIGITLTEQIFVERGYVASHQTETPIETNRFRAGLFWI